MTLQVIQIWRIGLAKMMGFTFPENFQFPYISQNITEFWRRWHITLGRWMRDYLYIPLGGNRVSVSRLYFNLTIVFLISGIWHGASWNFLIWGGFHGLFLVADRLFLIDGLKRIGKVPSIIFTWVIVLIGWVFFRAGSMNYALDYLGNMFAFQNFEANIFIDQRAWFFLIIAAIGAFMGVIKKVELFINRIFTDLPTIPVIMVRALTGSILAILCLAEIFTAEFNPFIYFRF